MTAGNDTQLPPQQQPPTVQALVPPRDPRRLATDAAKAAEMTSAAATAAAATATATTAPAASATTAAVAAASTTTTTTVAPDNAAVPVARQPQPKADTDPQSPPQSPPQSHAPSSPTVPPKGPPQALARADAARPPSLSFLAAAARQPAQPSPFAAAGLTIDVTRLNAPPVPFPDSHTVVHRVSDDVRASLQSVWSSSTCTTGTSASAGAPSVGASLSPDEEFANGAYSASAPGVDAADALSRDINLVRLTSADSGGRLHRGAALRSPEMAPNPGSPSRGPSPPALSLSLLSQRLDGGSVSVPHSRTNSSARRPRSLLGAPLGDYQSDDVLNAPAPGLLTSSRDLRIVGGAGAVGGPVSVGAAAAAWSERSTPRSPLSLSPLSPSDVGGSWHQHHRSMLIGSPAAVMLGEDVAAAAAVGAAPERAAPAPLVSAPVPVAAPGVGSTPMSTLPRLTAAPNTATTALTGANHANSSSTGATPTPAPPSRPPRRVRTPTIPRPNFAHHAAGYTRETWAARRVALVTGITGQDGSYLAELLLDKGYEVHGIIRRSSSFNTSRLHHLFGDGRVDRLALHYGDLTDSTALVHIISQVQPSEVYNLGAQSHVKVSFEMAQYTADVDGTGTLRLLDAIRTCGLDQLVKFYQASTSEMYGQVSNAHLPQSETTPFHPRSPYGVAKLYAYWITVNYRESYGLFTCNGILFNHESPRRGRTFVTRKISRAVAEIALGRQECVYLGNMDARRDWGHARDYVEGMWRMLQYDGTAPAGGGSGNGSAGGSAHGRSPPSTGAASSDPATPRNGDDYVLASGESHSVREFVQAAFAVVGKSVAWSGTGTDEVGTDERGRVVVRVDPRYFRPAEVDFLQGDASKARTVLGWKPRVSFLELVREMVEADVASAKYLVEDLN